VEGSGAADKVERRTVYPAVVRPIRRGLDDVSAVEFRYLELAGYDNGPHFRRFELEATARRRECTVLVPAGADPAGLFEMFLATVLGALGDARYLPIARFSQREFAFYSGRETTTSWDDRSSSIVRPGVQERHAAALRGISQAGFLCPNLNLAFLGVQGPFLEFLARHGMPLSSYLPFYFVNALVVNPRFLAALRGRRVALISSFGNKDLRRIRARLDDLEVGQVSIHEIPASGVAHGEFTLELEAGAEVAFVGAGIGAPLVLAGLAGSRCVAIDAGFVLHLWDGTLDCYERPFLNYAPAAVSADPPTARVEGAGPTEASPERPPEGPEGPLPSPSAFC
jgi:hypothetical protein